MSIFRPDIDGLFLSEPFPLAERVIDDRLSDRERPDARRRCTKFYFAKCPLQNRHQPTRPRLLVAAQLGQPTQSVVAEPKFDAVSRKRSFVLVNQAALALFENIKKVLCIQSVTGHANGEATDKLRL